MDRQVAEAIARVRESAVALEYTPSDAPTGGRRAASGVVISAEGEVVSVRIDPPPPSASPPILARVASGRWLTAQWVASDPETGLTLLKIDPKAARPATPSRRGPRLGMPVLVIGNPFGLSHSVSRGYVSGQNRHIELGHRQLGGLIQVDASIHPGDSGALVADLRGGWLGVVRSGLAAPAEKEEGERGRGRDHDHDLGFAIAARDALWVADELRAHHRVDRAYLGVTMDRTSPPPPGEPEGALLDRVLADTPAERAGLKPGDRVVSLDGRPVRSPFELTDRLDRTPADATVTVDLYRGSGSLREKLRLTLRTARRPPFEPSEPAPPEKEKNEDRPRQEYKDREVARNKPDEPRPEIPREIAEMIEGLKRRVEELEKERRESTPAAAQR
jgi:S1-C subfamily serine protease